MNGLMNQTHSKRYIVLVQVGLWVYLLGKGWETIRGQGEYDVWLPALVGLIVLGLALGFSWFGTSYMERWIKKEAVVPLEERPVKWRTYTVQSKGLFVLGLLLDGWDMFFQPNDLFFLLGTTALLIAYPCLAYDLYLRRSEISLWEQQRAVLILCVVNFFLLLWLWSRIGG